MKTKYRLSSAGGAVSWLQYATVETHKFFGITFSKEIVWKRVPAVYYYKQIAAGNLNIEAYVNTQRHNYQEFIQKWPNIDEYLKQLEAMELESYDAWKDIKRSKKSVISHYGTTIFLDTVNNLPCKNEYGYYTIG